MWKIIGEMTQKLQQEVEQSRMLKLMISVIWAALSTVYMTSNSSCDKDRQIKIGKANSVFERLKPV